MGGGCPWSQDNPLSRALTQLAGHNVTAGHRQGASQPAPPVCQVVTLSWPFNSLKFCKRKEREIEQKPPVSSVGEKVRGGH